MMITDVFFLVCRLDLHKHSAEINHTCSQMTQSLYLGKDLTATADLKQPYLVCSVWLCCLPARNEHLRTSRWMLPEMVIHLGISSAYNAMKSSLKLGNKKVHLLHIKSVIYDLSDFPRVCGKFQFPPSVSSPFFCTYNRVWMLQKPWSLCNLSFLLNCDNI